MLRKQTKQETTRKVRNRKTVEINMNRLNDEISLEGKLEYITMMDLRSNPGEILTSVSYGKAFVITRNGKPIAVLSRVPGLNLTIDCDSNGEVSYHL